VSLFGLIAKIKFAMRLEDGGLIAVQPAPPTTVVPPLDDQIWSALQLAPMIDIFAPVHTLDDQIARVGIAQLAELLDNLIAYVLIVCTGATMPFGSRPFKLM